MWAKFHSKCFQNLEIAKSPVFSEFFAVICCYHGNALSATVEKCILHIYTPRQTSGLNSMRIVQKLRKYKCSSWCKIFSPFLAIICCYHGNTLSVTVKKMCLAHLHPKANICAKFHENWWKTEEVVRDARFSPHFCHNMPLPWQHTFCHCQKNVSCTSTPQGKHLC